MGIERNLPPQVTLALLYILTRLAALPKFLWYNEASWAAETRIVDGIFYKAELIPHMPLGMYLYKLFALLFGTGAWAMRLLPALFGLASLILLYRFAKRLYDERVALIASLAFIFLFYPFLATIQVDMDGSIILFLTLATMYAYVEQKYWLVGILAAIASLARLVSGPILLAIVGLHWLYEKRSLQEIVKTWWLMAAAFLAIFCGFAFVMWLHDPANLLFIVKYSLGGGGSRSLTSVMLIGYGLLLIGPLLLWPLLTKIYRRENALLLIWVGVLFGAVFLRATSGDLPRYVMPAIPALCILLGVALKEFDRKVALWGALGGLAIFYAWNALVPFVVPSDTGVLLEWLRGGAWNFLFFFTGSSMAPLYVAFPLMIAIVILGGVLVLAQWKGWRIAFALALGALVASNLFLVAEFTHPLTKPDPAADADTLMQLAAERIPSDMPIYADGPLYDPARLWLDRTPQEVILLTPFNDFTKQGEPLAQLLPQGHHAVLFDDYLGRPLERTTLSCERVSQGMATMYLC